MSKNIWIIIAAKSKSIWHFSRAGIVLIACEMQEGHAGWSLMPLDTTTSDAGHCIETKKFRTIFVPRNGENLQTLHSRAGYAEQIAVAHHRQWRVVCGGRGWGTLMSPKFTAN